jgi:hypothetical protein
VLYILSLELAEKRQAQKTIDCRQRSWKAGHIELILYTLYIKDLVSEFEVVDEKAGQESWTSVLRKAGH